MFVMMSCEFSMFPKTFLVKRKCQFKLDNSHVKIQTKPLILDS